MDGATQPRRGQTRGHTQGQTWRASPTRQRAGALAAAYAAVLRRLPVLYLVWASLFGATVAWITPPWQNPDEPTHVARIVQLSLGGLVGRRIGTSAGGRSDPAMLASVAAVAALPFHPEAKMTRSMEAAAGQVRWGRPGDVFFPNTAMYPPFLYAAAVPAAWIGRAARLSVLDTLRLIRLCDAIAAAGLGAAALAASRRTRLAIASVLVLPMSLYLAASSSQDALMIPAAALAVALIDRARCEPAAQELSRWGLAAAALCLLAVVTARPPYLLLAVLPLLLPAARARRSPALLAAGLAAVALLWSLYVNRRIGVPTLDAQPGAQTLRLLHHPFVFVRVLAHTLGLWGEGYVESTVGLFGWADTHLRRGFVQTACWVIPLGLLSAATPDAQRRAWPRWLAVAAALGSAAAVFLSMYIIWSPLLSNVILGVGGRYFLPLLPALALGMPNLGRWWGAATRPAALLAVLALAATAPIAVLTALVSRYYMGP